MGRDPRLSRSKAGDDLIAAMFHLHRFCKAHDIPVPRLDFRFDGDYARCDFECAMRMDFDFNAMQLTGDYREIESITGIKIKLRGPRDA